MRQVIIYPGEGEDEFPRYWVAECPTLPGCISQGRTREEAIQNIREAIDVYVAVLKEDGLPVPSGKGVATLYCDGIPLFARPGSPDPGQKRGFGNPLRAILDPLRLPELVD